MTDNADPMALAHEAMQDVQARLIQSYREAQASLVTRPAVGTPVDPQQRMVDYLTFRADPYRQTGALQEQSQRYNLQPDPALPPAQWKIIPRNVVDYVLQMEQELQKRQEGQ